VTSERTGRDGPGMRSGLCRGPGCRPKLQCGMNEMLPWCCASCSPTPTDEGTTPVTLPVFSTRLLATSCDGCRLSIAQLRHYSEFEQIHVAERCPSFDVRFERRKVDQKANLHES